MTADRAQSRGDGWGLRTVRARWFELLTARDDLTTAVEALARTGSVELETHSEPASRMHLPDLHDRLEEYHRLAQRYQEYWPATGLRPSATPGHPSTTLEDALDRLHAWQEAADPLVRELERLHSERENLELLDEMLRGMGTTPLRLSRFARAGPALTARLFVLPARARVSQVPTGVITSGVRGGHHDFLLAVGPTEEMNTLEQDLTLLKGRRLPLHEALGDDPAASRRAVRERLDRLDREERALRERLDGLQARHELHEALGNVARLEWFLNHVAALPVTENFAWITGWSSDLEGTRLEEALEAAGVRGLLRFPPPPRDKRAPMVMHNPWWAQPFELFARLLGTPDENEADPSRLLVAIVPLMFGYMFGDVGQGAVLLVAGFFVARRWPAARLLIPAGLSAMVFGVLFGSVFSREDLIPALWLHPLHEPVTVLLFPLLAGVLILLLGLALNGIEARWRGEARRWWQQEAATVALYLGLVIAFIEPRALWLALAGLLWYFGGSIPSAQGRYLQALAADAGMLLEHALQLAVNTLSFARVGAFALAHAGLSAAVAALAATTETYVVALLIMVVGNALIIVLEGLVVSIQTTRLILFEFFIRFLRGEGRGFRPLAAPPTRQEQTKE